MATYPTQSPQLCSTHSIHRHLGPETPFDLQHDARESRARDHRSGSLFGPRKSTHAVRVWHTVHAFCLVFASPVATVHTMHQHRRRPTQRISNRTANRTKKQHNYQTGKNQTRMVGMCVHDLHLDTCDLPCQQRSTSTAELKIIRTKF